MYRSLHIFILLLLISTASFAQNNPDAYFDELKKSVHQSLSEQDTALAIKKALQVAHWADSIANSDYTVEMHSWLADILVQRGDYAFALTQELTSYEILLKTKARSARMQSSLERIGEIYTIWHSSVLEASPTKLSEISEEELLKISSLMNEREKELEEVKHREAQEIRFFWIGTAFLVFMLLLVMFVGYWRSNQAKNELKNAYAIMQAKGEEVVRQKDELEKKSEELQKALRELKNQRFLLHQQNDKLQQAKTTIEEQNIKLKTSNVVLEEQVKIRTSELKDSFEELLKINRQLDYYSYRSAHDLKGPIARVLGLCQIGMMEDDQKQVKEYFGALAGVGKEMLHLVNRIIDGLDVKTKKIEISEVNLQILFEDIYRKYRLECKDIGIRAELNITPDLIVSSDRKLLKILFSHLIENSIAFRHSHRDSYFRVDIEKRGRKFIKVSVSDNGIGIPTSAQGKIFGMFSKATTESKGVGLGLYEARLIAEKLGGQVDLEASNTDETVFVVILPVDGESSSKLFQNLYYSRSGKSNDS